ncbi:MAG: tRNA pseudouridine(38-40) synthase TruA [Gammaproteobacteria bacterium]
MRIALGIEYDGSNFSGWQIQQGTRTVQQCVEQALSQVADCPINVVCAGRTDTGVHALEQVVHFDCDVSRPDRSWVFGSNANLSSDVSVLWARQVDDDFHARFSAEKRRYRYIIYSRAIRPTFLSRRVTWDYRKLDERRMQEAAINLVGKHDFSSYRATSCQSKSPVRQVYFIEIKRRREFICIDIEANAFLHHMVRNIAGVLMEIGSGQRDPDWARQVLEEKDRTLGGVTALSDGLYLVSVSYPPEYGLPALSPTFTVW